VCLEITQIKDNYAHFKTVLIDLFDALLQKLLITEVLLLILRPGVALFVDHARRRGPP